ncbi:VOC family protein [Paucibacter sp. R3-3]|uniref:VOC family protein n=1 Tax=Roseateles agri TaxID=3098619 RepID=A0ABU5DE14_9BURK|nr:VOC family protein [Paucibacter sp. R3-3]MDY0743504.1 VOC family protein [Paucibacter sp. R3-3]
MQLKFISITVPDQQAALEIYTSKLGFTKMADIPMGEYRWLTVTSPDGVDGAELVLEPLAFPPAATYQKALFEAGIPATAFITQDIAREVERLRAAGVTVRGEPKAAGPITFVMFEDGCGNLINLVQPHQQNPET